MGAVIYRCYRKVHSMTSTWLKVYYSLPSSLRSIAASMRGLYIRSWRYGPETERLVQEAINREGWSPDQWRVWQEERLAFVLHRAATKVPYYREQWAERRRRGDRASWEYLENWPILEKDTIRENARAFVADDCDVRKMYHEQTSGSTGKPLSLWASLQTIRTMAAWYEARLRCWNGVSRHNRWATIAGQLVTPVTQREPPFWVWNQGLNQLYMSSYHLASDLMESYLDALLRYRVTYLYAYPSSLYALAQTALELGRKDLHMAVALTSAEPLYEYQREAIAKAFNCPVRETYGMAELVAMASECTSARLHLWPEVGCVEVMKDGLPVLPGSPGDLVCTGLLNVDMPLIRYRVGDQGCLEISSDTCQCGRTLPVMASVDGRIGDILYTKDGRRVGRLSPVFKGDLAIREAQIIQETLDCVKVKVVPTPDFASHHESVIVERLKERMGDVEVVIESVAEIPRGASGKFRAVVCKIPGAVS